MDIRPPLNSSTPLNLVEHTSLLSPNTFTEMQLSEPKTSSSPENSAHFDTSATTLETSKTTCSLERDDNSLPNTSLSNQVPNSNFESSKASSPTSSSTREEILRAMTQTLVQSIFQDEIQDTLERFVASAAFKRRSDIAIRFHREVFKTAILHSNESQSDPDATEDEDDETLEKKLECEYNDPFRNQILKDWDNLKHPYDQKLHWLDFRLKQLQHDLAETENALQHTSESSSTDPSSTSTHYKFVNEDNFPLEKRKESYLKHPLFIDNEMKEKTARMHRDDIISSFKLFHLEFPRRRKQKTASSSQSQLYVDIPEHNHMSSSPVLLADSQAAVESSSINDFETTTPKHKKKPSSQLTTPSSSKKSLSTTLNSSRRVSARRQQSVDDIVVPWGDIRNNAIIEEAKPKEIFTPHWRVMDTYSPLFPKLSESVSSTTTSPMLTAEQFDDGEEEDISDEVYCRLHIPEEYEERKKVYDYYMAQSANKNKRRKETIAYDKFKTKEEIHAVFERHHQLKLQQQQQQQQQQQLQEETTLNSATTPTTPIEKAQSKKDHSHKIVQPISAYKINKDTVIPRHLQIEISSYIPEETSDPFAIRGNFEEMGVRMKEEQIRLQILREEKLKSRTYSKSHSDSHGNDPEDYLVDLENAVFTDDERDENAMDEFIQDDSDEESEGSDFGEYINGELINGIGSSNRKRKKAKRRDSHEISKKQKICSHQWVYVRHVSELKIVLKKEQLFKQ